MKRIAILASGSGTNAEAIMNYFEASPSAGSVVGVISNNRSAYVLERAANHHVPHFHIPRDTIYNHPERVLAVLEDLGADFIVLAGFMLLLPPAVIDRFNGAVVNIHPALLPKFGGKGMYGEHVHQAVIASGETKSGITIHFVTQQYDRGTIIFQAEIDVTPTDTPESLATKIHALEQEHFPRVIAQI